MKLSQTKQQGFTLVEMIVALGLFSIVVTVAVGGLLVLIATNEQLQAEQSVMTNLSFALDSMTREIRTGTNYLCETINSTGGTPNMFNDTNDLENPAVIGLGETNDCFRGRQPSSHKYQGIAFNEGGGSITGNGGRILYYFDKPNGIILRRFGSNPAQSIVSSGLFVTNAEFYVSGSRPLKNSAPGNPDPRLDQPAITIIIEAKDKKNTTSNKVYRVQTTITQRTLDI